MTETVAPDAASTAARSRAAASARAPASSRRPSRSSPSVGYHDASIVKITEAAGVAQGTFYLYFGQAGGLRRARARPQPPRPPRDEGGAPQGTTRARRRSCSASSAFFRFTAEHPALYRIIRQAEFVSPDMLQLPLRAVLREGYVDGLPEAMAAGEIAEADPEVVAWALMGDRRADRACARPLGRRIAGCPRTFAELERIIALRARRPRDARRRRRDRGLPARALDERGRGRSGERHPGGRPRREVRHARQAHRARPTSTSATCRSAGERLLDEHGVDPGGIDAVVYFGSMWRTTRVAGRAVDRAPARRANAFALEFDNVSCGGPCAAPRAQLPSRGRGLRNVLLVGASQRVLPPRLRERALPLHVQLRRRRRRVLLERGHGRNELLASHAITDGSLSLQVKVPSGGSVDPERRLSLPRRRRSHSR